MNATTPFFPDAFCLSSLTSGVGILSSSNNSRYKESAKKIMTEGACEFLFIFYFFLSVIPCHSHTPSRLQHLALLCSV